MKHSIAALPDAAYLARIGEVAYTVSYAEWTILGDLHRLSVDFPSDLTLNALEPETTGQIANLLNIAAKKLPGGAVRDYVAAASAGLQVMSTIRNNVLHARPATHDDGQRLLRAEVVQHSTTGVRFWIDDDWLDASILRLNEVIRTINAVRPSLP